jgi:putative DeoR family transcriptional regulator (stage III sporulation protein D)
MKKTPLRSDGAPGRRLDFFISQPFPAYTSTSESKWGVLPGMKGNMEERACALAVYMSEQKATVRGAAKKFGISKSTVHKDIQERLPTFNRSLYQQVKAVLEENKAERHIRGGIATRIKYRGE